MLFMEKVKVPAVCQERGWVGGQTRGWLGWEWEQSTGVVPPRAGQGWGAGPGPCGQLAVALVDHLREKQSVPLTKQSGAARLKTSCVTPVTVAALSHGASAGPQVHQGLVHP